MVNGESESTEEKQLLSFLGYFIYEDFLHEGIKDLAESAQQLQRRSEALERELQKREHKPTGKVAYTLLLSGVLALISSIIFASTILTFIGLGLTLWGALLLFVKPNKYVRRDLVDSATISSLTTIDKIISDYQGKAIYLPSHHFVDAPGSVLAFIPAKKDTIPLLAGDGAKDEVFLKKPKGIYVVPPGLGLANLFEKKLGVDFSEVNLDYVTRHLPKLLIEGLEIVEDFEMDVNKDLVHVKMTQSIYGGLCNEVMKLTSVCSRLGCPLCGSIACILTKVTQKPVVIDRNETSYFPSGIIEAWYRIIYNQ